MYAYFLTQVKNTTLRVSCNDQMIIRDEIIALRDYTAQEILSYVQHVRFNNSMFDSQKVQFYGSMSFSYRDINEQEEEEKGDENIVREMIGVNDEEAHRLVVVLTKV
jgi:hypothetical protein